MGFGTARTLDRGLAAFGQHGTAQTTFVNCSSVSNGGFLFALPALLLNGLLADIESYFSIDSAHYYSVDQLMISLSMLIICRVKSIDRLKYMPVAEWGKVLGLDRIPAASTLRKRIGSFCVEDDSVEKWTSALSAKWLEELPKEHVGTVYCDGHVRVYHGHQTKLPRRYVSRQRLCLRGTSDYWVNERSGLPIFVISTPHTSGLLAALKNEIIPRLIKEIPNQPTDQELEDNPYMARFKMVFDREGYSPAFFKHMWEDHRIACQTYHKYPADAWDKAEFKEHTVIRIHGNETEMNIAERGTLLGKTIWCREIRRLMPSGHQTSVVSMDFITEEKNIAGDMFDRWSQENFFKYARENLNIDSLITYDTEEIDPETTVTNPLYNQLTNKIRAATAKINRRKLKLNEIVIDELLSPAKIKKGEQQILVCTEEIEQFEQEKEKLKEERSTLKKKVPFKDLPELYKFRRLHQSKQQFMNALRIIAYRAETALVNILKQNKRFAGTERSILKDIFSREADLVVDSQNKTLTVRLHHLANKKHDDAARLLITHLNDSQIEYPNSDLILRYELL